MSHDLYCVGNKDDDSEGQRTPPPLPTKARLNSDTTTDSKENLLISSTGASRASLTEAPSSMVLPSQLRGSANLVTSRVCYRIVLFINWEYIILCMFVVERPDFDIHKNFIRINTVNILFFCY